MKDDLSRASIAVASFFLLTLVSSALLLGLSSTPTETGRGSARIGLRGGRVHLGPLCRPVPIQALRGDVITFSGVRVRRGIVAADPDILPIGSVIEVHAGRYSGIYTVMDTGDAVKGTIIDIYMPNHEEAIQFARRLRCKSESSDTVGTTPPSVRAPRPARRSGSHHRPQISCYNSTDGA